MINVSNARTQVLAYVVEHPGCTAADACKVTDLPLGVVLAQLSALREAALVRVEEVGNGSMQKRRRYFAIGSVS